MKDEKSIKSRMSDFFEKYTGGGNKKRFIENTVIVVITGIIIIIAGSSLLGKGRIDNNNNNNEQASVESNKTVKGEVMDDNTEEKMKLILSKIEGAGNVDVMITYVSGKEIVPTFDIKTNDSSTREKDANGGTRDVEQNVYESRIVYIEEKDGVRKPVVIKDLQPVVKGVVVVAEGAGNPDVKEELTRAVQALMDIPIHRIQVFKRKL
jgi:stage III sporulation protein AG